MAKFRVEYQGKKYDIDAPDEDTALAAFADSMGIAPAVEPPPPAADPYGDLPYPGNPNFDPVANAPKPNLGFGTSSSSTLDPMPALSALGNNIAANVPIAGPYLKRAGENVDAWATGQTPEQRAQVNADMANANPIAADTGKVVGAVAPYAVASSIPAVNAALGFSGPMLQRFGMTAASQYGINFGDNMAHGQAPAEAAGNAVMPSLLSVPTAIFGPSGQKMTPSRAAALDVMKQNDIPLTGGQATMNKKTMMAESQLGGATAQNFQEKQLKAFTKAAMKSAGVASDIADPDALKQAYDTIGKKFEALATITQPRITTGTYQELAKVVDDYSQLKGTPAPLLSTILDRIGNLAVNGQGTLKGKQYGTLITDLRKYAESSTDIELKSALGEMREIIDDAVEQTVGGQTRDAWRKLRAQYRNLIVVTDAVGGGGEMALQGIIDPVSLNNAVRANVGKRSYAKGVGDLNELSRAGRLVMPKLPDSGTASRLGAMGGGLLGSPAGIISYFASGGDLKAGLGAAALTMGAGSIPYLSGKAMLSKPGRAAIAAEGTKIPATVMRGLAPLLMGQ